MTSFHIHGQSCGADAKTELENRRNVSNFAWYRCLMVTREKLSRPKRSNELMEQFQRAVAHHNNRRFDDALEVYSRLLEEEPKHPEILFYAGMASFQTGDVSRAAKLLERAVIVDEFNVEASLYLGNVYAVLNKFKEAADVYQRTIRLDPARADAHANLGSALCKLGRFEAAITSYRRAMDMQRHHLEATANLALALIETGRLDEAIAVCETAISEERYDSHIYAALGTAFNELGDYEHAIDAYRKAISLQPDSAPLFSNLGTALQQSGKLDDAISAFARATELLPTMGRAYSNLADALLEKGSPADALVVCNQYLEQCPGDSGVLATKTVVLQELGDVDAARCLADFDRFIRAELIDAPAGFTSVAEFNVALSKHVTTHPSLTKTPTSNATRFGSHTGELLIEPKGPISSLEAVIGKAVNDYIQALKRDEAHPFVKSAPRDWRLNLWAVVMSQHGHQVPHIHPAAWLSGVYYAELPTAAKSARRGRPGWIEFGMPMSALHYTVEPEVRAIRPAEGLLLLFPSYFFHRTIPYDAAERRISIAFDVLSAGTVLNAS